MLCLRQLQQLKNESQGASLMMMFHSDLLSRNISPVDLLDQELISYIATNLVLVV